MVQKRWANDNVNFVQDIDCASDRLFNQAQSRLFLYDLEAYDNSNYNNNKRNECKKTS